MVGRFFVAALLGLPLSLAQASKSISQDLQIKCPSKNCYQLERNLHTDSLSCEPSVAETFSPPTLNREVQVTGSLFYFSLVRSSYRYDVFAEEDGNMLIGLRIGVEGSQLDRFHLENLWGKVKQAETLWNIHAPHGLRFAFQLVDLQSNPHARVHFKVLYVRHPTRGPYNKTWSGSWSSAVLAHEIGHMLGLNDEYELDGTTPNCSRAGSLMCSLGGVPNVYHYYLIARRIQCTAEGLEPLASRSLYQAAYRAGRVDLESVQTQERPNNCIQSPSGKDLCI